MKTDIVFINPPLGRAQRYGKFSRIGSYFPPLGLCSLTSVCGRDGFSAGLIDAEAQGLDFSACAQKALGMSPRFIGITATTLSVYNAAELAKQIKLKDGSVKVIIGGVHVTSLAGQTMERFGSFDLAVMGEAEHVIVPLLRALSRNSDLSSIPGIAYRQGDVIKLNPRGPDISDLDDLPQIDWDKLEGFPELYTPALFSANRRPAAMLVTSRGCPGQCTFCDRSVFGQRLRFFSAEYLFEQVDVLRNKYGIKEILFYDDTFVADKKRLHKFCDRLIAKKMRLSWNCMARAGTLSREELKLMKTAGCWQIGYGIESGSQEILAGLKKNINLKMVEDSLKDTKRAGISTKGYLMIGSPKETLRTFEQTLSFVKKLALDSIHVSLFTPFPGSKIYDEIRGSAEFNEDWSKMNQWNPVYVPAGLKNADMRGMLKRMVNEFHFRPRIILVFLRKFTRRPWLFMRYSAGIFLTALYFLNPQGETSNDWKKP